jgi:hypothetical protein
MSSAPLVRATLLATLVAAVSAHAFMSYPAARGALSGSGGIFHYDPVDSSCPVDYCPECQNAAFLQNNHGDMMFTPYTPLDGTQPFRTGFGLCGDSGMDGRDPLRQPHMKAGAFSVGCEGKPSASGLTPGQVLNIQVQSSAACGGDITPQCFQDKRCVQLLRVPHPSCEGGEDIQCAPIDRSFPGRWYIPCHEFPFLNENTSEMVRDQTMGGPNGKMAYQIPADFNCGENCVLQSYWVTMNKCNPIGGKEYFENLYSKGMLNSWATCLGDGITRGGFSPLYPTCGSSLSLFPEEFWNCADISMAGTPFNNHDYSQYNVPGNNGSGAKRGVSNLPIPTASNATGSSSAVTPAVSPAASGAAVSPAAASGASPAAGKSSASAGSSSQSVTGAYIATGDGNDAEADNDEDDCEKPAAAPSASPKSTSGSSPAYYGTSAPSATATKANESPASYYAPSSAPSGAAAKPLTDSQAPTPNYSPNSGGSKSNPLTYY